MYTPAQSAQQVGVSVKTLHKWDRINVLHAKRTITNRRYYTEDDVAAALRLPRVQKQRRTVAYCRVSSHAHKPDLANQQAILRDFCQQRNIQVDEWVMEIGGGLNFKRKAFFALVDAILDGQVERVVLAHQDRLARFGDQLLVHLCQSPQCELLVMNTEELSPEQDLVQDLITITQCFSSRLDGLRNDRKALKKAIADDQSAPDQAPSHALRKRTTSLVLRELLGSPFTGRSPSGNSKTKRAANRSRAGVAHPLQRQQKSAVSLGR
jgi:putative resolvase